MKNIQKEMSSSWNFALPKTENPGQTTTRIMNSNNGTKPCNNTSNFWFWIFVIGGFLLLIFVVVLIVFASKPSKPPVCNVPCNPAPVIPCAVPQYYPIYLPPMQPYNYRPEVIQAVTTRCPAW